MTWKIFLGLRHSAYISGYFQKKTYKFPFSSYKPIFSTYCEVEDGPKKWEGQMIVRPPISKKWGGTVSPPSYAHALYHIPIPLIIRWMYLEQLINIISPLAKLKSMLHRIELFQELIQKRITVCSITHILCKNNTEVFTLGNSSNYFIT